MNDDSQKTPRFEQVLSSLRKWPKFFPPDNRNKIPVFLEKLGILQGKEKYTGLLEQTHSDMHSLIECMIEDDLKCWFEKKLKPDIKEPPAPWDEHGLQAFVASIGDALDMINNNEALLNEYAQHIQTLGLAYLPIIFDCLDANLQAVCNDCVTRLDDIMDNPKMADVHDHLAKISMRLFCSIKSTALFSAKHPGDRDRRIGDYESWFNVSLPNWIETWKRTSVTYAATLVENDNDYVKASDMSNYLESSVNVLSLCTGICNDYLRVKFERDPVRYEAIVFICDTICSCVESYSRKLAEKLKNTKNFPKHMDIEPLILTAANSADYVGAYISEKLLTFLETEESLKTMEDRADEIRTLHKNRLERCVQVTHGWAISLIKHALNSDENVNEINDKVIEALPHPEDKKILRDNRGRQSMRQFRGGEGLLKQLDMILHQYKDIVFPNLFPPLCSIVFERVILSIRHNFKSGQRRHYYLNIEEFMKTLNEYFTSTGTNYLVDSRLVYNDLWKTVTMCRLSTHELLLQFHYIYSINQYSLTDSESSKQSHINLKLGCIKDGDIVQLFIRLINGRNMPALDLDKSSDIYIRMELDPFSLFPAPQYNHVDSKVIWSSLNPDFGQTFKLELASDLIQTEGAVLTLTAFDKDRGLGMSDDLAGQCTVSLPHIMCIPDDRTINDMPTIPLLLQMPSFENEALLVLQDRRKWDDVASSFVHYHTHLINKKSKPHGASQLRKLAVTRTFTPGIYGSIDRWMRKQTGMA